MIRRILLAADGSKASNAGLQMAADLAARLNAELQAVFVEDEQRFVYYPAIAAMEGGVVMPVPLSDEKMKVELAKVEAERQEVQKEFDRCTRGKVSKARLSSIRGDINAVLVREARAADLVVMGRRGHFDPPTSKKAGPTTETLIHEALRPVLVVPATSRTQGPVLIAYDDSKGVQRVLPTAMDIATQLHAPVVVLTVDDKAPRAQALQEPLKTFVAGHGVEAKYVVRGGHAAEAIVDVAEKEKAGLLVMGAFNRNPIYELFFGSTTLNVLEHTPCPVLLMA